MRNLAPYEKAFDSEYPKYAERYGNVLRLTQGLDSLRLIQEIELKKFEVFVSLVRPLIEIKNYKSQSKFPTDLKAVLCLLGKIKKCPVSNSPLSKSSEELLGKLIGQEGFQLPTASACFHFCHPNRFPIVDRNVAAACKILAEKHQEDFEGLITPELPRESEPVDDKVEKYRSFVRFIKRIRLLQRQQYGGNPDLRFIDRALMVFGGRKLKEKTRPKKRTR